ncbi:MAG: prepilin-type N-terminal cleavage/methylation domain-containing protein [Deltaproteobacteria bacterium]|nr:prepilin-type N-terminal cleavage/methylation domain-containing protein [Deltaproteobacteria bacterium]
MTLKLNHNIAGDAGLTLVEVLIAMSIFVISFLVLVDTQNISLRNSAHSKRMTTATLLAQEKLSEMTLKYKGSATQGKSLSEIPEKEEGKFEGSHSAYRWEETSRDFKYDLTFLADMAQAAAGGEEAEPSPLATYLPKISEFIQNSAKEITVTVFWKEGAMERKVSLTTHLFDTKAPLPL